jgi:uncharacterized protein YbjT (DUF2867 family)
MTPASPHPLRTALVAGATGLVGRAIVSGLLADPGVGRVHALVRRELPLQHPKLAQLQVDFKALPTLPAAGEVYLALGTTIKAAGSQEAFRAIDFEANLATARAARAQGTTKAGVVSAMGADARSRIFYNRVKGELEDALQGLGFGTLVVARPSFLVGDRQALGQPERPGERWALRFSQWLAPVIPANLRSIQARSVAQALLSQVSRARGVRVLLSGEMQPAPARRRAA